MVTVAESDLDGFGRDRHTGAAAGISPRRDFGPTGETLHRYADAGFDNAVGLIELGGQDPEEVRAFSWEGRQRRDVAAASGEARRYRSRRAVLSHKPSASTSRAVPRRDRRCAPEAGYEHRVGRPACRASPDPTQDASRQPTGWPLGAARAASSCTPLNAPGSTCCGGPAIRRRPGSRSGSRICRPALG